VCGGVQLLAIRVQQAREHGGRQGATPRTPAPSRITKLLTCASSPAAPLQRRHRMPAALQVPIIFSVYALVALRQFRELPAESADRGLGPDFFGVPPDFTRKALADVMGGSKKSSRAGSRASMLGEEELLGAESAGEQRGPQNGFAHLKDDDLDYS